MITQLLSQLREGSAHFFTFQQRFHSLLINFGPLFADPKAFLYFARRDNNYAVSIRHDEISRVDRERPDLFR